jgi:hypothetical protein
MNKIKFTGLFILLMLFTGIASSQQKLNSAGPIPILAWYSIPADETSVERYQEMKDAGITYSLSFYENADQLQKALDAAGKVGIKIIASCPELKTDPVKTVHRFMNHPALAGYHLGDEPNIKKIPELGAWGKKIQTVDNAHFCYANLFPNFADSNQLGTKSYERYVDEYIKELPLQFISFDYYPVFKDHLAVSWYQNLEQVAGAAKKSGLPFWAFALTTNYDEDHVTPQTLAAMRLQVYSDLAYGAQGIEYFTYWSATAVDAPSGEDQRGAPISAAGKRSVVYDRVKLMSREINDLSGVFMGSKVLSVRHTGLGRIPVGTIRLTTLPKAIKVLDTNGAPALVSVLENGLNSFVIIVNKDYINSMKYTLYGDESVRKVLKDGTLVPASAYESSLELDPGDAAIYMFPTVK